MTARDVAELGTGQVAYINKVQIGGLGARNKTKAFLGHLSATSVVFVYERKVGLLLRWDLGGCWGKWSTYRFWVWEVIGWRATWKACH